MAGRFKLSEERERLLKDGIDLIVLSNCPESWQASRKKKSMGNKGCGQMQSIVYAWIAGLGEDPRLRAPLEDAATHLKEAIDKKMVIDYVTKTGNRPHPEYEALDHNQCAIIAYWLKGDLESIPEFARRAMEWYRIYMDCDYDWGGKAATPGQRRKDCGNYLLYCINAREFAEGMRYFEELAAPVGGRNPPMPRLARLAYRICKARLNDESLDEKFLKEGERLLEKNMDDTWLFYGRSVEAAFWIKAIYYDAGFVSTPQEAFGRARAILEKCEQAAT